MRGPAQLATYAAAALVVGGFVTIVFAWNGAAELNHLAGQFPYLVSGGLIGVGMIAAGCALWLIQLSRQLGAERTRRMHRLDAALASVAAAASAEAPAPTAARPTAADAERDLVVIGRSSYHDPGCRLISKRDDLPTAPRGEATADGLSPCGVCKPAGR
jgi:hypothetical protein